MKYPNIYGVLLLFLLPMLSFGQFTGEAALADKYFEEGEYEQALDLYQKVHRKDSEQPHFVYRIAACHDKLGQYEDGIKFLEKLIRKNEKAFDYEILMASLMKRSGDVKGSDKTLEDIIYKKLSTRDDFARTGNFFYSLNDNEHALQTYLQGRKTLKGKAVFSPEIANLYLAAGEYGPATREFLMQYEFDPASLNRIKNQILSYVGPGSSEAIENVLIEAVQKDQKDKGVRTLIYEFYVLNENFFEAFLQVKSIDKLFRENGDRVYKFALTMRNNDNYKLSNKALDYIIENHKDSPYYFLSFKEKTVNNELQAFETIPLDSMAIREAVAAYDDLFQTFGRKATFYDAMYRKAKLLAFYLNDLDGAMTELNYILTIPVRTKEKAEANLLIGDILLMEKEYAKAKLKYAEVADNFKDEQIGALSKFKEGQLSYFKGDFELAQARLKSIKDNTSNDISNDAIRLNMLIQDNTGLDSTTTALQIFAQAQLLVFQRDYPPAMALLDSLAYNFPNHTLADEILWEKANIYLAYNDIDQALLFLDKIIDNHGEDILADDALFTKAKIYDYNKKMADKAMEYYLQMLRDYPGSLFSVEVRKRIRELRKEKL